MQYQSEQLSDEEIRNLVAWVDAATRLFKRPHELAFQQMS